MEKETSDSQRVTNLAKAKILVNWKRKKIIHTHSHIGSKEYQAILAQGYERVGEIKAETKLKVFWDIESFEPEVKYITRDL